MNKLSNHQKGARLRREREQKIARLCRRLDAHITAAEKLHTGKTRQQHLNLAAAAREQLRVLDH